MNKLLSFAVATVFALVSSSAWCAEQASGKKYQSIYVSKVIVEADMDKSSPDEVKYYADLETEATSSISKWFKDEGYVIAESPDSTNDQQITIQTKAIFNAGNQALRWVGGLFGAGKATALVIMEVKESASGKVVSAKQSESSMRMGGLGGSAPRFLLGVVDSAWNLVMSDLNELK